MRLVIAAPANGAILKDALKAHLQNDQSGNGILQRLAAHGLPLPD